MKVLRERVWTSYIDYASEPLVDLSKLSTSGPHPRPESEFWCGQVQGFKSAQLILVYRHG